MFGVLMLLFSVEYKYKETLRRLTLKLRLRLRLILRWENGLGICLASSIFFFLNHVMGNEEPACLHLRLKGHLTVKTD